MKALQLVGLILTLIGSILLAIIGGIYLGGYMPLPVLAGIGSLVLGLGLIFIPISMLCTKKP
ncbi:MAG TPA: hypothetical protein DCQ14_06255 [Firmicutes bacterium]|nr:hypothetical protein [Bacillota bacterium]